MSAKQKKMESLTSLTARQASKYGPYGEDDKPCTVVCYGERIRWKSRKAAAYYFSVGARACEGAERERYQRIVTELTLGKSVASDGEPVIRQTYARLPKDPMQTLRALKKKRDSLESKMDAEREAGKEKAAQKIAEKWNEISLEIISLEKSMRHARLLPPLR